jgi:RNA polymerase sigma-70 factor, ECF subfamily
MSRESLQDLLERWRKGEQQAAGEIYCRYERAVLRHARQRMGPLLRNRVQPESIMLLVLEYVLRGVTEGSYTARSSQEFLNLIKKVTNNKIRDQLKYHTRMKRDVHLDYRPELERNADPPKYSKQAPPPEADAIFADELVVIQQRLGPDLFEILQLQMEGHSYEDIAQRLEISWHSVSRRAKRIKKSLQAWRGDGKASLS